MISNYASPFIQARGDDSIAYHLEKLLFDDAQLEMVCCNTVFSSERFLLATLAICTEVVAGWT